MSHAECEETMSATRVAVFSTKRYDEEFLTAARESGGFDVELTFFEARLTVNTAALARGFPVVCAFVNDELSRPVLSQLAGQGTRHVALRSAGFNNVDLAAATELGLTVTRVPDYSPFAVAEFTLALILALNRKLPRAHTRVRDGNFLLDGLLGFDLHGTTAGVIGTGKIGSIVARLLLAFGVRTLAYDVAPSDVVAALGVRYTDLDELLAAADIVSLHCPLLPETHHLIDREAVLKMKSGVMLINTSRGGLIDTAAVIRGLKSGRIGYLGLDVYEEEAEYFFEDFSTRVIEDDTLSRLLTFPNVIVTGHQGYFTAQALHDIARTTLANVEESAAGRPLANEVRAPREQERPPRAA